MAENRDTRVATHFGRQMRKERLARGWSLAEFSQHTGINAGHLSRIENGRRPATRKVADACDAVFPERRGWFTDWYDESLTWSEVPAGFRNWTEIEDKAARVRAWSPGVIHGLLQTEATPRSARHRARGHGRGRDDPSYGANGTPTTPSLMRDGTCRPRGSSSTSYRYTDSSGRMRLWRLRCDTYCPWPRCRASQRRCSRRSLIRPVRAGPAGDESAWVEHVVGGIVYTGETVSSLSRLFDSLRGESYRVSESAALLERMCELWATGASPASTLTAETA